MFILLKRLIIVWNTCLRQHAFPLKIHNMADMGVVFARKCTPQNDRIKSCVTTWNSCVKPQEVPSYGHTSANNDNSRLLLHLHEVGCGNIIRNQRKEHLICTSHLPPFLHKPTLTKMSPAPMTQKLLRKWSNTTPKGPKTTPPNWPENDTRIVPKWLQNELKGVSNDPAIHGQDDVAGQAGKPRWSPTLDRPRWPFRMEPGVAVSDVFGTPSYANFWNQNVWVSNVFFWTSARSECTGMNQDTANSFVLKDPYPNQKQYHKL